MTVVGLFRYPVKSLRACAVPSLEFGDKGPLRDREFMVVDSAGTFVSQRTSPRMAQIQAQLVGDRLVLSHEATGSVEVVEPEVKALRRPARIWKSEVMAVDGYAVASAWLSDTLSMQCSLVRFGPASQRRVDLPGEDVQTTFTDGYPVLVTNTASLSALNERLVVPVGMERFRPNLVVSTSEAWVEHQWKVIRVGELELELVKPCARCAVITTDQLTGARPSPKEPLATLASFRALPGAGAIFGENAVARRHGTVRLGEAVEVVETRVPPVFRGEA